MFGEEFFNEFVHDVVLLPIWFFYPSVPFSFVVKVGTFLQGPTVETSPESLIGQVLPCLALSLEPYVESVSSELSNLF